VPPFQTGPRFQNDWRRLTAEQRERFRRIKPVLEQFVPDLIAGHFRAGLRVKGVQDARRSVYEMTWASDGRATFEYGLSDTRASLTSSGAVLAPMMSSVNRDGLSPDLYPARR
jgi:hypothetical protein